MAVDWIKMRVDLQSHPKVVRILSATKSDKFRVIGGLHAVWSVFDAHCEDGVLNGYTPETLDHIIGWDGFSSALVTVGWLVENTGVSLAMPEFSEHNGQSAKRRAEDQKRKRDSRNNPEPVRKVSAKEVDKKQTREEKRREDIDTPSNDGFELVYQEYPKKVGKPAALKAFRAQKVTPEEVALILRDIANKKNSVEWKKDGGQYIPYPATYINQRRWLDQPAQVVNIMRGVL
jgi:hypothetical protein